MEELISIVGFGVGASAGVALVRAFGDGLRPVVRGVMRAGMGVADAVSGLKTEAQEELHGAERTTATSGNTARSRRRAASEAPQRIVIAHE